MTAQERQLARVKPLLCSHGEGSHDCQCMAVMREGSIVNCNFLDAFMIAACCTCLLASSISCHGIIKDSGPSGLESIFANRLKVVAKCHTKSTSKSDVLRVTYDVYFADFCAV